MILQTWSEVLVASFQNVWAEIVAYVPNILVSIIVFVVGWVVAVVVGRWVAQLLRSLKIDRALASVGVDEIVGRAGYRLDSGAFIGGLVKVFVIIIFLVAALDVLKLSQINVFLYQVILGYIPNVIAAALILLLAAIIADALQKAVVASAKAAGTEYADLLGGITRWSIWIFAILAAFNQLDIGAIFAQTLFTGLVAMLAIAGGLSFGLGGKDAAARYIEKLRNDISKK
jgi:hypothetical protein